MRRFGIIALALVCGWLAPLSALQALTPGQQAVLFASAPYVGPGDLVSGAAAWYGLRGYSRNVSALGTQKAINIRRASDNATLDILILPNGALNVATATTFCAATTCFVTKEYDQSGNGTDATQATAANQPQLVFSVFGTLPAIQFNNLPFLSIASISLAQPISMSAVAERTGNTSVENDIFSRTAFGFFFNGANIFSEFAGSTLSATASDSVLHAIQAVMNNASSVINIDGTETTGTAGVTTISSLALGLGAHDTGTSPLTGYITEAGLWSAQGFSSAQRAALKANQHSYWGF